ncbi:MAG: cytochrome c oxidase subunit 3 family protein [Phycisphaerae bacterium]|nr:cytochrome c oxidase subunit 3 family protein [Phycisphaerae bacterium]
MSSHSAPVDPVLHGGSHTDAESYGAHTHQHQFDNPAQQHEAAALGMWSFLATEVLFFGAVFTAYTVYRHAFTEEFVIASKRLYTWVGAVNTGVLLCSSLTVALAVRAAHLLDRTTLFRCLIATVVLGLMFVGIKMTEYAIDYKEHLIPKLNFQLEESDYPNPLPEYVKQPAAYQQTPVNPEKEDRAVFERHAEMFFIFYFTMTGIHALHMLIGIVIMLILAIRVKHGAYQFQNHNSIEMTGLYWHFVDVVWIFLFPLLYLIR